MRDLLFVNFCRNFPNRQFCFALHFLGHAQKAAEKEDADCHGQYG